MAIFLDIAGAFDNLQWVALFRDMLNLGCSPGTMAITRSYLTNRSAHLTLGGTHKAVKITRGCPQGPVLWNITMEALLKSPLPDHARIQSYADDIVISLTGRSKPQLQSRAKELLTLIKNWGTERSLRFSTTMSAAVILRGSLLPGFFIEMGSDRIKVTESAKFLGVWLDQSRSFRPHIEHLRDKNFSLFSRLRGVFGKSWGLSRENALLIYNTVFIPKVCYASRFWAKDTRHSKSMATLTILQRTPLLGISSAYSTTSNDALQVLTGTLPLDLEVRLQAVKAETRSSPQVERLQQIETHKHQLYNEWQNRWDASKKGRLTHKFLPSITSRMETPI